MIKKFIIYYLFAYSLMADIHIVDTGGKTYDIKEENIIKLIKEHVANNQEKINKNILKAKKTLKKKFFNYKPKRLTKKIPIATQDKVFYIDPTYTLKFDIKDNKGNILYPKGYRFNPLHFIFLKSRYIFIDYTDIRQRKWIKDNNFHRDINSKILLVNGNIWEAIKEFKRDVYYANDMILNRFKIEATPSVAVQNSDRIKIFQYKLKEKNGKRIK